MRRGAILAAFLMAAPALAHDGVVHESREEAAAHLKESANTPGFPVDSIGGSFRLTDQHGEPRTEADPEGRHQLFFFGYASCKAICSVALPAMAAAVDQLEGDGIAVTPVLITVDPERDTVRALSKAVPEIHPRLVGLTGSETALGEAYAAFKMEKKLVMEHPTEGPIYAHGSFIYLLEPSGAVETVIPPILAPERIAEIVTGYVRTATH